MVDLGVRRDIDCAIGCVERNTGASHERRGRSACGGWTGQTRHPDDCERELGRHRGGDEERERDVSQVGGQVQRVDRVRVRHRRQSVVFSRFPLSFSLETDMKFIILHETKNDDGIKVFFTDLWELYLKVRAPSVVYFPGVQSVSDGHESVPHCAHADTQHGVRQSGEGEREEESVAAGALFAVSSLPLSPIPVLRLLLLSLSLSLSLFSNFCSFSLPAVYYITYLSKQEIIQSRSSTQPTSVQLQPLSPFVSSPFLRAQPPSILLSTLRGPLSRSPTLK